MHHVWDLHCIIILGYASPPFCRSPISTSLIKVIGGDHSTKTLELVMLRYSLPSGHKMMVMARRPLDGGIALPFPNS